MTMKITSISLFLPYHLGRVNCYLIQDAAGYLLVDTGSSHQRAALESELERAGCRTGNLKLIVLTHGDFDHTGNAAYLRQKFGANIALGEGDAGMAERGDMFWNRQKPNRLLNMLSSSLFGFGAAQRFAPDLFLRDGDDLSAYGFDARAISIPGHSLGSIGLLTAGGDLFCGDLLISTRGPALNSILPDRAAAIASLEKLKNLPIRTVYPGHGEPFTMDIFIRRNPNLT
jgi:hydroxyacylglutathione hydrolase